MLEIVQRSADSLLTIINDILDFSKIEAGKLVIESVPFDLGIIVDDSSGCWMSAPRSGGSR